MTGTRRKSREISLQVLFQLETGDKGLTLEEVFTLFCHNFGAPREARAFAWELVTGVKKHLLEIDDHLNNASEHWRLDRMSHVDRTILRQALYEMLYLNDIPAKVSLNEAIDLGKKFGTDESGAFINGVLDRIHRQFLAKAEEKSVGESEENPE
ncbi:MAG: transcription antitermination factor NusB [Deltaproteobacteria bacterium]|nr:transcription antitermination factor NusB [Deltaproteobacteria bacterium]MBW2050907.1 transcription antitermination factor NusB [Deltaproteobacteria bacterium]MBW2139566.1 transcription antitermination factor NusB [Deltaproteobacteria bacterium]MBW2322599.1 transcription antitermination factor NusB [Deltaproteobacteria bacterium]